MEGKTLIVSALLLSLVLGQIRVEAKSCCPSTTARNIYNACRLTGASRSVCASASGCKIQDPPCPNGWKHILENNAGADEYNEFCKLGCSSSVCGAIISLHESDASEVVSGAAEKCNKACSAICAQAPLVEIA